MRLGGVTNPRSFIVSRDGGPVSNGPGLGFATLRVHDMSTWGASATIIREIGVVPHGEEVAIALVRLSDWRMRILDPPPPLRSDPDREGRSG